MHLPFEHATDDHSQQLRPCLQVVQNYRFQFEIVVGGKIDCYPKFICLSFPLRKNKLTKSK